MINILIRHLPDDPLAMRISIGGTKVSGYYCLFRGNQKDCTAMLETILTVLKNMPPLGIEEDVPEIGKS